MPAHRSRTERWRECLQQVYERGGGIEFSFDHGKGLATAPGDVPALPDVMWRVRVMGLSDSELLIEHPGAAGSSVSLKPGTSVVGVISVGQNRWMFQSRLLGPQDGVSPWGAAPGGLRMAMPTKVERCHRREFMRASVASLHLPPVECWQLMSPTSAIAAEAANAGHIRDLQSGRTSETLAMTAMLLPEVGPKFTGKLLNIGGGGVGIIFDRNEASSADRCRLIWMRVDLRPVIAAPIAMTARLVHKHIDSEQNLITGAAFDFAANPSHREFVVDQIVRYVNHVAPLSQAA